MPMAPEEERAAWGLPALLAIVLVGALYLAQAHVDFNPADEGFQWYGAVQTAHGQVPLRDFASYEPGRYLWSAAWSKLFGEGLLALRLSTSIFACVGLFFGLLAARRAFAAKTTVRAALALAGIGVALTLWMVPRYKMFEPAWAMTAVWFAVRLLERPSLRRHLAAGVFVGLASFLGKNHLLYCGVAFFALIAYERLSVERRDRQGDVPGNGFVGLLAPSGAFGSSQSLRDQRNHYPLFARLGAWTGGIAIGTLPIVSMCLFVPGFFAAYRDSFLFFLHQGRTNFPLPIPWPWHQVQVGQILDGLGLLGRYAVGWGFILLPMFALLFAFFALTADRENLGERRLLLAAGFVGSVYMHHAFARADPYHLAQSIHPMLLGAFALPAALAGRGRTASRVGVALVIGLVTLFAAVPLSPFYLRWKSHGQWDRFAPRSIGGDEILISERASRLYEAIRWEVGKHVAPNEPLFIAPHMPGLYPLLGRPSPVWDIYPIWPAEGAGDERMLSELIGHDVRWALVDDYVLDGRAELGFEFTHPKSAAYLASAFERIPTPALPKKVRLLHRKDSRGPLPP
jgi:hypothetical protein